MGCGACGQMALYLIGEPIYDDSYSYAAGAFVVVAGTLYISLEDGNEGNNPQEGYPWQATTILSQLGATSIYKFGDETVIIPARTKIAVYDSESAITDNQSITLPSINGYGDGESITIVHPGLTALYQATISPVDGTKIYGNATNNAFAIMIYDSENNSPSSLTLVAMTMLGNRAWVATSSNSTNYQSS